MTTIRKKDGWLTAEVRDELVMMSVDTGKYIGLNEVGARIWQLLETPQSREALCAQLVREFDVSASSAAPKSMPSLTNWTGTARSTEGHSLLRHCRLRPSG
ncbi:MAG: PqqD family protein [Rhizomicrobium sp.]